MADIGPKRIAEFIKPFRVEPGSRVRLAKATQRAATKAGKEKMS